MTGLFDFLCSLSAGALVGAAIAYGMWIRRTGQQRRKWMTFVAPLWAAVAAYHAVIWALVATVDGFQPTPWLRPVGWLSFAIPAVVLVGAIVEDRQRHHTERRLEAAIRQAERALNG